MTPTVEETSATDHDELKRQNQAYLTAAIEAFASGRMKDTYGNLLHALWLDPADVQVLYLLSETCIRLGAIEHAVKYSNAVLAADPTFKAALAVQIEASVRKNDLSRAQSLLGQYPSGGEFRHMHAMLKHRLMVAEGYYEVALAELSDLIDGRDDLVLARELFEQSFKAFITSGQKERIDEFLDALGLSFDDTNNRNASRQSFEPEAASIDVIIPVYNAVHHLEICIASLRRYPDLALRRIILVDDASDQTTKDWMDRFVATNPDTILVRNAENLGFTRSVIAGIEASEAPFFIMLNSDTIVSHGWITGLWRGITAREDHAMAGPLSNLAYFQSISQPDLMNSAAGAHDVRITEKRAAFVRANGLAAYPRVPFLSGFCLMVRRDHYNVAGPLDAIDYPRGYWEVQDLALRMIDLGLFPCLVDDVYVHHLQSGSVATEQRAALLSDGFRRICARHGAIRVLVAEEFCRNSGDVLRQKDGVSGFFATAAEKQASSGPMQGPAAQRWRAFPPAGMISADAEICLFVAHAPYGQLSESTARYLLELRNVGLHVIVCIAVEKVGDPVQSDWLDHVDAVLLRENAGFDFGAWADLLRLLPELWTVRRLMFANDSVAGPFVPLHGLFEKIRAEDAGFFALTDSTVPKYHAQSYFFGWAGQNLSAQPLRSFWEGVVNLPDKQAVIDQYEIPLSDLCDDLPDSSCQILFGVHDLFGKQARLLPPFSPAHWGWKALINIGNPFVKTLVLREEPGAVDAVVAMTGADAAMLKRHVEQSKIAVLFSAQK